MDRYTIAAGLQLVSSPNASSPPATKQRPAPLDLEMMAMPASEAHDLRTTDDISITPGGPVTPAEAHTQPPTGTQTPWTPADLESTPPSGHKGASTVVGVVPSFFYPAMNRWRVLCACLTYLGNGMHDGGE